jgi:hypothetical protein
MFEEIATASLGTPTSLLKIFDLVIIWSGVSMGDKLLSDPELGRCNRDVILIQYEF